MPEGYRHLTCEQRCQIYALLQSGHSQAAKSSVVQTTFVPSRKAESQLPLGGTSGMPIRRHHQQTAFHCRERTIAA
jgi:hypothetical protein